MIECIEGIVKRKTSGPIRMDFFFRFFFSCTKLCSLQLKSDRTPILVDKMSVCLIKYHHLFTAKVHPAGGAEEPADGTMQSPAEESKVCLWDAF